MKMIGGVNARRMEMKRMEGIERMERMVRLERLERMPAGVSVENAKPFVRRPEQFLLSFCLI